MPSYLPSNLPTPFPSNFPTDYPTEWPSNSVVPSYGPTDTFLPSTVPTQSPKPSPAPSMDPTTTPAPTEEPSIAPTNEPTSVPSNQPSDFPTYSVLFEEKSIIDQNFIIDIDEGEIWSSWNVSEIKLFESVMAGYTLNISESDDTSRIEYNCTLVTQKPGNVPPIVINQVNYMLYWRSAYVNISGYAKAYPAFINMHLEEVRDDLQAVGLRVQRADFAISEIPTDMPTNFPTISYIPSGIPSLFPSDHPSERPSFLPSDFPTGIPSLSPTGFPSVISEVPSWMPSRHPSEPTANGGGATTAIVSVTVTLFALSLVGLFFFYRRRKRRKEIAFQEAAAGAAGNAAARDDQQSDQLSSLKVITDPDSAKNWNNITPKSDDHAVVGMISPSDSLLSNQSLLSPGDSMGGYSVEEADGTHHLADEFDQYKDQNLEKMRADVEENLHGSDGMMSKAMTKALMADEDPVADQSDLFWGGSGDPAEIEASALCEVNDWLKRKEGANLEDRRAFMQDTMNKMVASVRHGVMKPDEAARTIHECAALLGLELASDIAEDTVIVTGLRKNVTKSDLELTFREFGEIDEAAVASNSRGFGIVRFVSRTSTQETMKKFRLGEIVVQDVAVTVRVLKSQGTSFGSAPPEP
eukprot:CAMPEP_0178913192 /NCGR_PEP_ID=MMETSP0786-20121207/10703_1 /TAXON_ID=186022 /ORGANISM="Thalassionema frauenfeldii, Strain CCMP 1798" /LENGTH=636 /DNA_ID=CAMNT_0020585901 /DNA_START=465 /DNA_END=2375 /DNA_ORIENTATION=-